MKYIVDLSHHQNPSNIDYDVFASQLDLAIIRTQYGSNLIDKYYLIHHEELRRRGVPTHSYAWVRGTSISDMEKEAVDFFDRSQALNPYFFWLDIEEESMKDMRNGIKAYVAKLRSFGVSRIGAYVAHKNPYNIDLSDFDALWVPRYGRNTGFPDSRPELACDIHQYTSKGRLKGYPNDLDLNQIISDKPLTFFTGVSVQPGKSLDVLANEVISGLWGVGEDRKKALNDAGYDYQVVQNKVNDIYRPKKSIDEIAKEVIANKWGVGEDRKKALTDAGYNYVEIQTLVNKMVVPAPKKVVTHLVKAGDTVSGIARKYDTTINSIVHLNGLKDANKIKIGQVLKITK